MKLQAGKLNINIWDT